MFEYRYLSAPLLVISLTACEPQEVEYPMPTALGTYDERLFHCANGLDVSVMVAEQFDSNVTTVSFIHCGKIVQFVADNREMRGPWTPTMENGSSLEMTRESFELRDNAGPLLINDCRVDPLV